VYIQFIAYAFCGLLAGLAGMIVSSRVYSADANNAGLNIELDAILAVALGGNSLGGGRFSLLALFLWLLSHGCGLISTANAAYFFTGTVIRHTIGDFRSRDLASGGQGAPLVPAFHQALFQHPQETRVVLNIGGISNISVLPPQQAAFGFDTGPGNMLMDAWMQHNWQQSYDRDGQRAAQGAILPDLLNRLLDHPYFRRPIIL